MTVVTVADKLRPPSPPAYSGERGPWTPSTWVSFLLSSTLIGVTYRAQSPSPAPTPLVSALLATPQCQRSVHCTQVTCHGETLTSSSKISTHPAKKCNFLLCASPPALGFPQDINRLDCREGFSKACGNCGAMGRAQGKNFNFSAWWVLHLCSMETTNL